MCEFCVKHGEGKKWYEIMKHYSDEMLIEQHRQKYISEFVSSVRKNAKSNITKLNWAKQKLPYAYSFIKKIGATHMKKFHYGQVVPIEDAEKIIDMVNTITRISCICRSVTTGRNNARYCLLLGIDPMGLVKQWPELKANFETLTPMEAKNVLRDFDNKGLVHSIWTFKTPYIGAICNCDRDCLAYQIQIGQDLLNLLLKGEYIAQIENDLCVGCRNCQKFCHFGAIEYSTINAKCSINPSKCYGCGVCRSICKKQAIDLLDTSYL